MDFVEHAEGFTVKTICGCRIAYGPIPLREFVMLTHGFSKKAVMSTDIADRIGATAVIGEPENIEKLRQMDLPVSRQRHDDCIEARNLGLDSVSMWLRDGERGMSSNAMCKRMFGVPSSAGVNHPHDPDDLNRCLKFLDETNAHDRIGMMRDVSPGWAALIDAWDQIVSVFREEMKAEKSAPRTYDMMNKVLGDS